MKSVAVTRVALGACRALVLLMGLFSMPAQAFVEEITAVFRPDPGNPMVNEFENTTPQSGICPWHIPAKCKAMNIFTIRRAFSAGSNQPIAAYAEPRKSAYFKVPVRTNLWPKVRDLVKMLKKSDQPIPYRLEGEMETGLFIAHYVHLERNGVIIPADFIPEQNR